MGHAQHSLDPGANDLPQGRRSVVVIALSFAASFALACFLLLVVGHYCLNSPRSLWPFERASIGSAIPGAGVSDFVPFPVSKGGAYIKAAIGSDVNPTKGDDYALFVWFKLRKSPAVGEALGVVGKFDSQTPGRPGYAISLEGAPDGIRPRVYVSAGDNPGKWYSFSSHPMNRRDWYLLTVSIVEDTFLSVSLGQALSSEPPVLLGGHRISGGLPASKADLVVGAFGASRFRGQIGPFGILAGNGISKQLSTYSKAIQGKPGGIASAVPSNIIRLWASPSEDIGPAKFEILQVPGEAPRAAMSSVKPSKKDVRGKPAKRATIANKKSKPSKQNNK